MSPSEHPPIPLTIPGDPTARLYILTCGYGFGFLIESRAGLFLIDGGTPGHEKVILDKMREVGRSDLKLIWITHAHYDHYGSAGRLREITDAKIGVHPLDAEDMSLAHSRLGTPRSYGVLYFALQPLAALGQKLQSTPPDFVLEDGETLERFGLDASILHTPGHTPGHTSVVLAGGTAFAGDLLGGFPKYALQSLLATDWDALPVSLERLKQAKPERVYSGHRRKPISGEELQAIVK